jgi:hypothetical protein
MPMFSVNWRCQQLLVNWTSLPHHFGRPCRLPCQRVSRAVRHLMLCSGPSRRPASNSSTRTAAVPVCVFESQQKDKPRKIRVSGCRPHPASRRSGRVSTSAKEHVREASPRPSLAAWFPRCLVASLLNGTILLDTYQVSILVDELIY